MARYIDIEYLFKKLCCFADGTRIPDVGCDNFPIQINIKDIRHELAKAPTADVVSRSEYDILQSENTRLKNALDKVSKIKQSEGSIG